MKTKNVTDNSMYTGTPCDECGGPTLRLGMGSIWCPAEDPHPGGHFVTRVAFERSPNKAPKIRNASDLARVNRAAYVPAPVAPRVIKPQPVKPARISTGYDDFVEGSD